MRLKRVFSMNQCPLFDFFVSQIKGMSAKSHQPEALKKSMTPRKEAWSDTCRAMAATACCALIPALRIVVTAWEKVGSVDPMTSASRVW